MPPNKIILYHFNYIELCIKMECVLHFYLEMCTNHEFFKIKFVVWIASDYPDYK